MKTMCRTIDMTNFSRPTTLFVSLSWTARLARSLQNTRRIAPTAASQDDSDKAFSHTLDFHILIHSATTHTCSHLTEGLDMIQTRLRPSPVDCIGP